MKARIFHGDIAVWAIFFILCAISLVEVFSAGTYLANKEKSWVRPLLNQCVYLGLAALVAWIVHNIPCRYFKLFPVIGYIVMLILLVWALVAGTELNEGARWVTIAGFSFQPSEFAKGVMVMTAALFLGSTQTDEGTKSTTFWWILFLTAIPCALIITQNFSTAALLFLVIYSMMWVGRIPWRQMGSLTLALLATIALGYATLMALPNDPNDSFYDSKFTQRVYTWRMRLTDAGMELPADPREFKITDKNRQVVNARIALARAHGIGAAPGGSVQRDYLSAAYSDFIYAIIGEELGIMGCIIVVLLYIWLVVRCSRIASRCAHNYPAFLVLGLGLLLVWQAMLNMMVAVGIGPVTGQTLPMVSKGGTSNFITGAYFGMIISVSRYARRKDKTPLRSVSAEISKEVEAAFTKD